MPGKKLDDIEAILSAADPQLGRLIKMVVPRKWASRDPNKQLCLQLRSAGQRSIISQQLSVKKLPRRFSENSAKHSTTGFTPQKVKSLSPARLRTLGLSQPKARYLHNLADWFSAHGTKLEQDGLSDDDHIALLTAISGIGVWTVQMFLMFHLKRPDILPTGDLGIQKGVQFLYGFRQAPAPRTISVKRRSGTHIAASPAFIYGGRSISEFTRLSLGPPKTIAVRFAQLDARIGEKLRTKLEICEAEKSI